MKIASLQRARRNKAIKAAKVGYTVRAIYPGEGFCAHEGCTAIVEGVRQLCDAHAEK